MITLHTPKNRYKNIYIYFFSQSIRMSGKNVNFGDKNKKVTFTKTKKQPRQIDDIDVNEILVSKEELYGTKNHLNTLLDTMIIMLLDHYA